jgi:hypothetical protein
MSHYYHLRNLSVVYHNQMLVMRANPKTEATRLALLSAIDEEMNALFDNQIEPNMKTKAAVIRASTKVKVASRHFFDAKKEDDTHEPTFKVI